MIQISDVVKSYNKKVVVDHLSLKINDGEVFGLLGPNGAGKSTTLKMIAGILKIDQGKILIDDSDIVSSSNDAKEKIGYVFDSPDMFLSMKGYELIKFISSIYKIDEKESTEEAISLAKKLEIYDHLNEYIGEYSHGMRQKMSIITSLMHKPNNWILDEPLVGLDPKSVYVVKQMMRDLAVKNKTVLFSTHVLDVAEKICDRIGIIYKGKIIFCGTIEELEEKEQQTSDLESLYLNLIK